MRGSARRAEERRKIKNEKKMSEREGEGRLYNMWPLRNTRVKCNNGALERRGGVRIVNKSVEDDGRVE